MNVLTGNSRAAVSIEFPVRFVETDLMGVVHHSNYITWFEAARVAWMERTGTPYTEFAAGGNHFAVTNIQVALRASCTFGDTVRVTAFVEKLRSRQVTFGYTVHKVVDDVLLAEGSTDLICVDHAGHMARIPDEFLRRFEAGAERLQGERSA